MIWGEALWWLPTTAVMGLGLVAVAVQPSYPAKRFWLAAMLVGGVVAIGAGAVQQAANRATLGRETAAIAPLNARVQDLEKQIRDLREKSRARAIDPDTGAKLAEYLRQLGSHRVVVSCVPDDVEAYGYATQIANLLRKAGWEALGPEATALFSEAPTMGILVYVRAGDQPPEAAKILLDAFTRFNIPYQSGIMPTKVIPDPATVELFVGHKP